MHKKKICFYTNSGNSKFLGFGHLYRCINIANYFKKTHFCNFYVKSKISKKILSQYNLNIIQSKNVFDNDILFVDLPKIKISKLKNFRGKIIIIDEFNLIKSNKKNLKIYNSKNFKKILPLKLYSILFYKKSFKKKINIEFLASFGGSDYFNYSSKILKLFKDNKIFNFKIKSKIKNKTFKEKFINSFEIFYKKYKNIYFIGSGGNTLFEMAYKRIPCLAVPTNKIEEKYINYLSKFTKVSRLDFNKDLRSQIKVTKLKKFKLNINKNKIINFYNKLFK